MFITALLLCNSNVFLIIYPTLNFNSMINSKVSCAKSTSCEEIALKEVCKSNKKEARSRVIENFNNCVVAHSIKEKRSN